MKISELKTGDVVERFVDVPIRTHMLPLKRTKYCISFKENGDIFGSEMNEVGDVENPVKLDFSSGTWYFYQRRNRTKEELSSLVGRIVHVSDDTIAMLVAYDTYSNWFVAGNGTKYHAKTAEGLCGFVYDLVKIDS